MHVPDCPGLCLLLILLFLQKRPRSNQMVVMVKVATKGDTVGLYGPK